MAQAGDRKSIFITGAASGIGRATAEHFVKEGWFVGLYDVNEEGLKETAELVGLDNCIAGKLDVRHDVDWQKAIEQFSGATNGQMNVLFNNAGVGRYGWFEEISSEDSDWIIDVNFKGVVKGCYAALPLLEQTKGARIVNTASASCIVGSPQLAVYSATKFAVNGLTEALNAEFDRLDITVTDIIPWFVQTPILDMATREGGNDTLQDGGVQDQTVYPVTEAAAITWQAAHGNKVHYYVGKEAGRISFLKRLMPGRMMKQIKKRLSENQGY